MMRSVWKVLSRLERMLSFNPSERRSYTDRAYE
jgi:hypothetical protein